jgi:hypothetical protein
VWSAGTIAVHPSSGACPLVKAIQQGYTLSIESTSSHNVNDLPVTDRQMLEGMLGQPLSPGQRVFVMAYTPSAVPDESVRRAARERLQRTFDKVDQYAAAHGVTPEEADAALEEAMEHIRPRKS